MTITQYITDCANTYRTTVTAVSLLVKPDNCYLAVTAKYANREVQHLLPLEDLNKPLAVLTFHRRICLTGLPVTDTISRNAGLDGISVHTPLYDSGLINHLLKIYVGLIEECRETDKIKVD